MTRPIIFALASSLLIGCHGRYKRNADTLGKVRLEVRTPAGPGVSGGSYPLSEPETAQDYVEAGAGVATVVVGRKVQRKLQRAVTPEDAEAALTASFLADIVGEPLPYKVGDNGRAKLTIEIVDFGLAASDGTPTAFVHTRTTIHDRNGKKVYRASEVCRQPIGAAMDIPLTDVDDLVAMQTLAKLSPERMNKLVVRVASKCGEEVTQELLQHLD